MKSVAGSHPKGKSVNYNTSSYSVKTTPLKALNLLSSNTKLPAGRPSLATMGVPVHAFKNTMINKELGS